MQVDFDVYLHDLRKELARGRRRAAAAGYPLPVPPRVATGMIWPPRRASVGSPT